MAIAAVRRLSHAFRVVRLCSPVAFAACCIVAAQTPPPDSAVVLYQQLQSFTAISSVELDNAVLQHDRARITFRSGTLYLSRPVAGRIRSAVFIGEGMFQAAPPPVVFEQENVRRMLKAEDVSSDFKTAVLRFTDDSLDELLKQPAQTAATVPEQVTRLARELAPRLLKEAAVNITARQMESIVNRESPGVFLAQFDGGKRGRFTYLLDPQTRIPTSSFRINAGEKGLVFAYDPALFSSDVWMAFYSVDDYKRQVAPYSDAYYLVDIEKYTLMLDLLEPRKWLGLTATMDLVSRVDGLQVVPFGIGEGLSLHDDERRSKQLLVRNAHLADGTPVSFFQEPYEAGFTLVLAKPIANGQRLSVTVELRGEFMMDAEIAAQSRVYFLTLNYSTWDAFFPRSNETWYPRHGNLTRSKFDITMLHRKSDHVVSIGDMVREEPAPGNKEAVLTEFRMDQPVSFGAFAVGPYEIHKDTANQDDGGKLPLEFYSMPGKVAQIKEDFILAEMNNCVRYFSRYFGPYPYSVFRGAYHPFGFGQGLPTTIMIPAADLATNRTYSFLAHETSHQWWGHVVLWRSYQDQWLSEGFAEYSGWSYVQVREDTKSQKELIEWARNSLRMPPGTLTGIRSGRLVDIGPLIMGHRVETRESFGAYSALTYNKGALVLRMIHFLFTDPNTGDGKAFLELMTDFVQRYKGSTASTADFFKVANDRVKDTPLAQKYGYKDLNWFYRQWVLQSYLPSYELTYELSNDASGAPVLRGELLQKGLPEGETWFMPLPLILHFPGGKMARTTVAALGSRTPVTLKLPQRPNKIELDPELWVLSDNTSVR